jgi:hypothetical protein
MNRGKVSRHCNAKKLPADLEGVILPKFVVYYSEKIKDTVRDFFQVEGHPMQQLKESDTENNATRQLASRRWATTKSSAFTIKTKLEQAVKYASELDKLFADNEYTIEIPILKKPTKIVVKIPKPVVVETTPPSPPKPKKTDRASLKQWKTQQIYEAFQAGDENVYKHYCETNNDIPTNWSDLWIVFAGQIKATETFEVAEPIIRQFIEDLRGIRHSKLVKEYNEIRNSPDREDRQQWPSATILKVYKEGKISMFQSWLDGQDGITEDSSKRWDALLKKLEKTVADAELQEIISRISSD